MYCALGFWLIVTPPQRAYIILARSNIFHACKNYLKNGKLPPMSAKNGLKIEIQDREMELTELEGNLISLRLIFMEIYQLPKSRWTALKDKITYKRR